MPRHKVCGEFLSPEIMSVFARLGVATDILAAGPARIHATRVVAAQRSTQSLPFPDEALALSRFRLDQILWDAACAAGAQSFDRTRVQRIDGNIRDGFCVSTLRGEWQARLVVAAPGRNSRLASQSCPDSFRTSRLGSKRHPRYLGLKTHLRAACMSSDTVELHPFHGGYCGLVRIEDDLVNACLLARYDVVAKRSPQEFWAWVLAHCPNLARRVEGAEQVLPWLTTANITFGSVRPARGDVLHCGDAAGYIHPLTGDGMAMAARAGELAAAVISAALRGGLRPEDAAPVYAAAWQREFRARLRWAALLQPLLISPRLTEPAMALLARAPRLAQFAIAGTRGR
jgi:flavin-dependent dehydrogenase